MTGTVEPDRQARSSGRHVTISLEGRCVCPVHGELGPDVPYLPGPAPCGCTWVVVGRSGVLKCETKGETAN